MYNPEMKRPKILFIIGTLGGGGAEKVMMDLLGHTDCSKYDVDLCVLRRKGVYVDRVPHGINVNYIYSRYSVLRKIHQWRERKFGDDGGFHRRITRKIKGEYDAIVSFLEGTAVKYHSYIFDQARRNVSWVHTDLLNYHHTASLYKADEERRLYGRMDGIAFVSDEARINFQKLFGLDPSRLVTIYNPVDRENIVRRSTEESIEKNRFTIVCVGRICEPKRFDRAVRVAAMLKRDGKDVDFWILSGDGNYHKLQSYAAELGVEDMFRFFGYRSNPYPYIASADMFLMTSQTEGFPLVVCEALCLHKPIVSTAVTGPKEILGDSEYGLLTGQSDEEIYEGVRRMIDEPELRRHYSVQAACRSEMFDIRRTVDQIYDFILPKEN